MRVATACGCDTKTDWPLLTSTIITRARFAVCRWASSLVQQPPQEGPCESAISEDICDLAKGKT